MDGCTGCYHFSLFCWLISWFKSFNSRQTLKQGLQPAAYWTDRYGRVAWTWQPAQFSSSPPAAKDNAHLCLHYSREYFSVACRLLLNVFDTSTGAQCVCSAMPVLHAHFHSHTHTHTHTLIRVALSLSAQRNNFAPSRSVSSLKTEPPSATEVQQLPWIEKCEKGFRVWRKSQMFVFSAGRQTSFQLALVSVCCPLSPMLFFYFLR